jgi:hypothetical protein
MNREEAVLTITIYISFIISIAFEWLYWRRKGVRAKYEARDSIVNYLLLLLTVAITEIGKVLFIVAGLNWFYQRGLQLLPNTWWSFALAFLGVDLG